MSLDELSKIEQIALLLNHEIWTKVEGVTTTRDFIFKAVMPLPQDRSQLVFMRVRDTAYQLSSPFATTGDVDPARVFGLNHSLFGIDVVFDRYSLVSANLVEAFEIETYMETLVALAAAADEIEETLGLGDEL